MQNDRSLLDIHADIDAMLQSDPEDDGDQVSNASGLLTIYLWLLTCKYITVTVGMFVGLVACTYNADNGQTWIQLSSVTHCYMLGQ